MMPLRPTLVRVSALLLVAASAVACQTGPLADRAVVVYDRARTGDADSAARILRGEGVLVELQVRAPVPRSGSSIAVYDAVRFPDRPQIVADLLAPLGTFDLLPFPAGNNGTDIVVWLEGEGPAEFPSVGE